MMPGQLGNKNHLRHGLTCGALPAGSGYVKRITGQLRTAIENAVVAARGEITLGDAAIIQTAIRWERHALLAQRWLRREETTLTPEQRLAFSRDIARASAERDKCLTALRLNERPDPYASLYAPRPGEVPTLWPGIPAPPEPAESAGEPGRCRESSNVSIVDPGASCASDSQPETAGGAE